MTTQRVGCRLPAPPPFDGDDKSGTDGAVKQALPVDKDVKTKLVAVEKAELFVPSLALARHQYRWPTVGVNAKVAEVRLACWALFLTESASCVKF